MASSDGMGDAKEDIQNQNLQELWNDLYKQISDRYKATGPMGIPIHKKNFDSHIGSGKVM